MKTAALLFFANIFHMGLAQPGAHTAGNYTAQAVAARCTGTPVLQEDNGTGDSGTVEACAATCEANRPTCDKFTYRAGSVNKCHYFGPDCDPVGNSGVIKGTHFDQTIYAHNDDLNTVQLMDYFEDVLENTRCAYNGVFKADQGYESLRTIESCARKCFTTYKDKCAGFTYRTSGLVGYNRCLYHDSRYCRKYTKSLNWMNKTGYNAYWFKGDTLQHFQGSVDSVVANRMYNGKFTSNTFAGPCFVKHVTQLTLQDRQRFGRLVCLDNPNNGIIHTTGYDYNTDQGQSWSDCARACLEWNTNSSNTQECRAVNKVTSSINIQNFKCELVDCNPYPRPDPKNSVYISNPSYSNTHLDLWGYMDDSTTPSCRGVFADQHDREIMNSYDAYSGHICSSDDTPSFLSYHTSAVECAIKCSTSGGTGETCVAFSFEDQRNTCHIWSRCKLDGTASRNEQDIVYVKKFYLNHQIGIRRDFKTVTPGATCAGNPGSVLDRTVNGDMSLHRCTNACYENDGANCEFFEFDTNTCKIWSDCGGIPVASESALGYIYETMPIGQTLPPSPPVTQSPTTEAMCSVSGDCYSISGQAICTNNNQCEIIQCSKHEDCYFDVQYGMLPFCDFKFGVCRDYHSSNCNSIRHCRSQARKKWKKENTFASTKLRNQLERAEKRRDFTLATIQNLQAAVNTSDSVYITVQGTEVVEINRGTLDAVNNTDALYQSMINSYCGVANEECSYTLTGGTPTRRILQDENVTVVITYEVDENLYQDLVNTGFDFDNENFAESVADSLGIDASLVEITGVNGTIEIEVSIVDENLDGEPIGDDLIDDINNIQDSLENITTTVIDEIGANSTQIGVDEVDLCGDRQCNNQGTCNPSTGFCLCNAGYDGINCELKSLCGDEASDYCKFGGSCRPDGLACHCIYPHYGFRCGETPVACGTCT